LGRAREADLELLAASIADEVFCAYLSPIKIFEIEMITKS
jgi:hypothetical protein